MAELETFKIRAPLRCDGIGRLDCAEDSESGTRLAVRWLPLEANGKAAVQACQQLPSHPGLPAIRRTGEVGSSAYVALDFPEGKLLATMLGEALSPATLINVVAQLSDALATIHAQGVLHGEISADSVLLVLPEKAFLWDMPLVIANRLTDRRGEERLMHQLVKAAPFLAPERARGEPATEKSDVYAVGAIAAIAAGAELPRALTTLGVVHQVATGQWQPKVPRTFPEPMRSMLDRMVSADPAARPTARQVADLFMPTAVSSPTLREMAAISLPPEVLAKLDAQTPSAGEAAVAPESTLQLLATPSAPMPAVVLPEVTAPVPPPSVKLADNVSVDAELVSAGAISYSAEQQRAMARTKAFKVGGAVFGALLLITLGVAALKPAAPIPTKSLAVAGPRTLAPVAAPPEVVKPLVDAKVSDDDLLSPLAEVAKKQQGRAAPRKATPAPVAAESDTAAAQAPAAHASDFEFLEAHAEEELKRPEL